MQETRSLGAVVWRMQILGIVASFLILAGIIGSISGFFAAFTPSKLSVASFSLGVALFYGYFWWYRHLSCPECRALLVKPKKPSTDTLIYVCSGCHIHWDTGVHNDEW
jgi:hypothetical protein